MQRHDFLPQLLKLKMSDLQPFSEIDDSELKGNASEAEAVRAIKNLHEFMKSRGKRDDAPLTVWQHFEIAKTLMMIPELLPESPIRDLIDQLEKKFTDNSYVFFNKLKQHPKKLSLDDFYEFCLTQLPKQVEKKRDTGKATTSESETTDDTLTEKKNIEPKTEEPPSAAPVSRVKKQQGRWKLDVPAQIDLEDLDDQCNLAIKDKQKFYAFIKQKMDEGWSAGCFSGAQLEAELKEKCNHGVVFFSDNRTNQPTLYWLYEKHPVSADQKDEKTNAKVEILQKDQTSEWFVLKTKPIYPGRNPYAFTPTPAAPIDVKHDTTEANVITAFTQTEIHSILDNITPPVEVNRLIIPWMPGKTLRTVLNDELKNPFFNLRPNNWLTLFNNLFEKVSELHRKGYLHRDLNPEHVMVEGTHVEIVGFASAVQLPKDNLEYRDDEIAGTVGYQAKEIAEGIYSKKTDIYAIGILFAEALGLISGESLAAREDAKLAISTHTTNDAAAKKFIREGLKLVPVNKAPNHIIKDPHVRENILNFLHKLTNLTLTSPTPTFRTFIGQHGNLKPNQELKVCIININEFIELKPAAKLRFIKESQKYNKVLFLESVDEYGPKKHLEVYRTFGDKVMGPYSIFVPGPQIGTLKQVLDDQYPKDFKYTFITASESFLKKANQDLFTNQGIAIAFPPRPNQFKHLLHPAPAAARPIAAQGAGAGPGQQRRKAS